jgi:hypothetical protein
VRGQRYKSYLEKFLPPVHFAKQYAGIALRNVRRFARNDFHEGHGMRALIASFYQSLRTGESVPIPYAEILRTARIMDDIFEQLTSQRPALSEPTAICREQL